MPYRTGFLTMEEKPADNEVLINEVIQRQTSRGGLVTASYPLQYAPRASR